MQAGLPRRRGWVKKTALVLLALAVVGALGGAAYYLYLTAPVDVADTPPVAPTLALEPDAEPTALARPSTPTPVSTSRAGSDRPAVATPVTVSTPTAAKPRTARVYRIDPKQSKATYRVEETFLRDSRHMTAVGSTDAVAGEILVNRDSPARSRIGEIVVDISQLESDEPDRDNAIRRAWTAEYPLVIFKNARIIDLPRSLSEGKPFRFKMRGDLTIHDTTRQETWDVTATLQGDTLRGRATTRIKQSDYGIDAPNLFDFVRIEDEVQLTLDFVATARG